MDYLESIDYTAPGFGEIHDELPLWSAPFGLMMLDRVPIGPTLQYLDVGAGTGFLTLELAQRCVPGATVVAVDPWSEGLRRLRQKIDYLGLGNVMLVEGSAAEIELPDASIDVVVSNLGINNFEDADAVLRECFRVARHGARLLLTSNLVGHMQELHDVFRETLVELGHVDRIPLLDEHIAHRGTPETVSATIRRAGFEPTEITTGSFRLRFSSGSALLRHFLIRLGFLEAWKQVASPQAQRETLITLEERLDAVATEQGEVALTIPMACFEAEKR